MVNVQDNEPVDLSHLLPAAQAVVRLPDIDRIAQVRADRWIGYSRAADTLQRPGQLDTWPSKQRMAEPAADRRDEQRQVDEHREVPAHPPADVEP